ncbi:MAG: pyruvate kinase [Elusimicrobia bacterium CG08_land_8_20_14_0_20_59_10]|nr:MAG: pyruvate kinase [Elusimicrobia bacterium CG08_land_8_20_14_0_20_59_10]
MPKNIRTPRTKILATLGPASTAHAVLRKMYQAGLDCVRLNFSHGKPDEHRARVEMVRDLNRATRRHITVLQDLKGNRIRIGRLEAPLQLKNHQKVTLVRGLTARRAGQIPFDYTGSLKAIKKGHLIYIDDGNIALEVKAPGRDSLECEVTAGGLLKERKGVNIPLAALDFPVLSDEDRRDLEFALTIKPDFIAQSFVRSKAEVLAVRRVLGGRLPGCRIIAKIEAREAIKNLDEIIAAADGIMVARGDLGVMFPLWEVPLLQKLIIKKCNKAGKPVITATQMLESMTANYHPTRAEVSDVANAVLDGTDWVMLSAETAAGAHPVEAVCFMNQIVKYTEQCGGEFRCS